MFDFVFLLRLDSKLKVYLTFKHFLVYFRLKLALLKLFQSACGPCYAKSQK